MDAINQIASSAAKVVWGHANAPQNQREPISGATGDVSKGEPYDAGNMDPEEQNKVESTLNDDNPDATGTSESTADAPAAVRQTEHRSPVRDTDQEQEQEQKQKQQPDQQQEFRDASKVKGSEQNPPEHPANATGQQGPRPIETVAKKHGGDAAAPAAPAAPVPVAPAAPPPPAAATAAETAPSPHTPAAADTTSRSTHAEPKRPEEHAVKSTGLAADGGNFDASKLGAGREADRLMEEKGMMRDKAASAAAAGGGGGHGGSSSSHGKDKPSLGERIKNKLHKH